MVGGEQSTLMYGESTNVPTVKYKHGRKGIKSLSTGRRTKMRNEKSCLKKNARKKRGRWNNSMESLYLKRNGRNLQGQNR